ncbi:hypothetical protein QBC45DRAFT_415998 [Copromyces sp. CBS 386.78]|nr:hypothetical protein QBC45DRAFT_415998 [Copromyces sp. CBS 386.78]
MPSRLCPPDCPLLAYCATFISEKHVSKEERIWSCARTFSRGLVVQCPCGCRVWQVPEMRSALFFFGTFFLFPWNLCCLGNPFTDGCFISFAGALCCFVVVVAVRASCCRVHEISGDSQGQKGRKLVHFEDCQTMSWSDPSRSLSFVVDHQP